MAAVLPGAAADCYRPGLRLLVLHHLDESLRQQGAERAFVSLGQLDHPRDHFLRIVLLEGKAHAAVVGEVALRVVPAFPGFHHAIVEAGLVRAGIDGANLDAERLQFGMQGSGEGLQGMLEAQ